ncbi:MAG TPA: ABC transporter permease, partial [bacterium]|nr:ABC transporter permease [bacterium]
LAGRPGTIRFAPSREGIGADYEELRVRRAAYTVLADLVAARRLASAEGRERAVTPDDFAALAAMPRALTVDVRPAGARREIPTGFAQAVPGILVMFLLLVMATSGAVLLVIERRQGLLRRLASTPIAPAAVVLGKWGGRLALGLVQLAFGMLVGTVLFGMDWGPDLGWVIVVLVVYAALMAGVGLLVGTLARTEGQAVGIGVVSANVLGALGGCWWPIEIAPAWMQTLQLFLPTGWAMHALHRLIAFGSGPAGVVPHLLGMTLATLLVVAWTSRVFRWE